MTIVLQFDIQTAEQQHKLQQVLDFVSNLKLPFRKVEPVEDDLETITIRERLTEKYVKTGEWENMDDEERQDMALLEKMLWLDELPNNQPYSVNETKRLLEIGRAHV